jgi:hypothetical protein
MIRSLVAMLLLGFVVMPESKPCYSWCSGGGGWAWCHLCRRYEFNHSCSWCDGSGNIETTYGELRRGYIPEEGEAQ